MGHTIFLKDMLLRCILGVRPHERAKKQPVRVHIAISAELGDVASRDEIAATVDYSALHDAVVELVEGSSFNLVETLAERVAELCLEDSRVTAAEVTVEKPHALGYAASVGVTVRKERSDTLRQGGIRRHGTD